MSSMDGYLIGVSFDNWVVVRRTGKFVMGFLLAAALSACAGLPAQPAAPEEEPVELEGTSWSLRSLHGSEPVPDSRITLQFADGWATGDAGCNSYGGEYRQETGNRLTIPEVISTLRLCAGDAIMEQESDYLGSLQDTAAYRVVAGQLELRNSAGESTLVFDPAE